MLILDAATKTILFNHARVADTFFKRAFGLLYERGLSEDEALIFKNAPCIHTFFMRFSIDVVFLEKNGTVIRLCEHTVPFRMLCCFRATYTIEAAAGTAGKKHIHEGQKLSFVKT